MNEKIETGGLIDTRPQTEKDKDYLHEEIAAGPLDPIKWEEKQTYKEYYPYDQGRSLSCVAGGGVITEEHFNKGEGKELFKGSRKDIYQRRFNYPGGGMMLHDLFKICITGMGSEDQVPSQGLGETDMNQRYPITDSILSTRKKHRFKNWVAIKNFTDEDTLAQIVDHTPIVAFWYFDALRDYDEWWRSFPTVVNKGLDLYGSKTLHHQAMIIDRTIINGIKYFVVQDTAGVGLGSGVNKNIRFVTMDFIKERLYAAGYGVNNLEINNIQKPNGEWKRILRVGSKGDDVKSLQAVLIYEKMLPIKEPTGYFGGLTFKAVCEYQKKYSTEILKPLGLTLPTGIVGNMTLQHLNKTYGIGVESLGSVENSDKIGTMSISDFMEGKKTYTGIAIAFLGMFGVSKYVTSDQVAGVIDAIVQLIGLGLAIYGRFKAEPNEVK